MYRRALFALPILLGVIVALWGCAPYSGATGSDKSLEARVAKLEKDLKTAQDQAAASAASLKTEQAKLKETEKDRDEVRASLKLRTDDLAKSQGDLQQVQKGLKEILGKVEAALNPSAERPTAGAVTIR